MVNQRFAIHPPQLVGRIQAPRPGEDPAVAFRRMHGELDGAMQELQRFLKYLQNALDNDQTSITNVDNSVTNLGDQYNLESAAVPVEHTHSAEEVLGLTEDRAKLNLHEHPHSHARQDVHGAQEDHDLLNLHEHPHSHAEVTAELGALGDLANLHDHPHTHAGLRDSEALADLANLEAGRPHVHEYADLQGNHAQVPELWINGNDAKLYRDAANVIAQKNGTNAQELRVYGSTTGPAYLRLVGGTTMYVMTNAANALNFGTGGSAAVSIVTGGAARWYVDTDGSLNDIGRPSVGAKGITVKANAAQTGNLQEWNDSAGSPMLAVNKDGQIPTDFVFAGSGSGLPYGSLYGNDIAWTQAAAVQNTWYDITDADIADGQLNLVTHDGNGMLTVSKAGRYLINYALNVEASVVGEIIESGIDVSGTVANDGRNQVEIPAVREGPVSGTAILSLAANDTVEVAIRATSAGTPNLTVEHVNLTLVQVGG